MKKGILTFFICFGLFAAGSVAYSNELTDDYFDIATNYYNANDSQKALEYVEDILKIDPCNTKAQELKDKIAPSPQPPTVAEPSAQTAAQATEQNSNTPPTIPPTVQANGSFVILNVPQADVEKMNYDSDYYNKKGQELYQQKDYNGAITYFYKSINLNKKNEQAYNNMAMAYWLKGNTDCAIKYFKKANSTNRHYTQPLVNLAQLYKQTGDEKKQVLYLEKAIKDNPNDYCAYYFLGEYYRGKSEYTKAIDSYKEAVKINDKFSQSYLGLAICFFETEEFSYTLMALGQYREYNPTSDFAIFLTAKTELVLTRYIDAKSDLQTAIAINDKPEYQHELGIVEYYLGNYQSALDIFQPFLQTTNSAEIFNYVGLCNYKLKNIDAAIANFNKAIQIDGMRPIYYYNLAQCYKSLGDKANYVKYVKIATKTTPINYQDSIDLSYIYYDNGNPSYALNTLNSAIKTYPSVKALYLSKLKIYEAIGDNLHYNETKDLLNERFNSK